MRVFISERTALFLRRLFSFCLILFICDFMFAIVLAYDLSSKLSSKPGLPKARGSKPSERSPIRGRLYALVPAGVELRYCIHLVPCSVADTELWRATASCLAGLTPPSHVSWRICLAELEEKSPRGPNGTLRCSDVPSFDTLSDPGAMPKSSVPAPARARDLGVFFHVPYASHAWPIPYAGFRSWSIPEAGGLTVEAPPKPVASWYQTVLLPGQLLWAMKRIL